MIGTIKGTVSLIQNGYVMIGSESDYSGWGLGFKDYSATKI